MPDFVYTFDGDTRPLKAKIKDAANDGGALGDALADGIAKGLEGIEDKVGSIRDSIKSALTFEAIGSFGDFLTGFSAKGEEAVDAMRKLQAQTGLVGEGLKAARADADELFLAGVGENVSEAIGVIASARKELGTVLDKEGLGDFTKTAAGIGKAFDTDVNEVLAKSRTFIKNFGLEGKEAGDLVALGMRNAANADGDFLDTLAEYSPLMKKAGLDAQQFTGILTKGVQEGARNTDVLADSIKEAGIRLSAGDISNALKDISGPVAATVQEIVKAGEAGSLSTVEVIQKATKAIGTAFDAGQISDTMRSQLQVAIAGTPAEDIGADLYQRIFSAPIDTAALTQEATKAGEQIAGALGPKTIFESLSRNFDLITTKVSEFAAPVIAGLGGVLTTFGQIAPAISLVIPLLPTLAGGFTAVWTAATGPVGLVIAGIAAVGAAFFLLYKNVQPFADAVDKAFEFIGKAIDTVMPAFEAFGDLLLSVGSIVLDFLVAPFEVAWAIITSITDAIFGASSSSIDFGKILETLGAIVGKLTGWIKDAKGWIDKLKDGMAVAIAGVKSFASDAVGAIGALFAFDFEGLYNKIAGAADRADAARAQAATEQRLKKETEAVDASLKNTIATIVKNAEEGKLKIDEAFSKITFFSNSKIARDAAGSEIDQALKDLEALKKKKAEEAAKNAKPIASPLKPKIEISEKDISAQILAIMNETQTRLSGAVRSLAELTATGIDDQFNLALRDVSTNAEKATKDLETKIQAIRDTVKGKKATEQIVFDLDPSDSIPAVKKSVKDVLALLNSLMKEGTAAISKEQSAALAKLEKDFGTQRIDAIVKSRTDETNMELTLLKAKEQILTGEDFRAVEERGRNRLAQLKLQQQNELDATLAAMPEFRAALNERIADSDASTDAERAKAFAEVRASFLENNAFIRTLVAAQQTALSQGNAQLANDIAAAMNAATDAQTKALRDGNVAFEAELAIREGFAKGFFDAIDTERVKSLEAEKEDLTKQATEVWEKYLLDKTASYQDYANDIDGIATQIFDKERALADAQKDFWQQALAGMTEAFKSFQEQQQAALDKALTDLNPKLDKVFSQIAKSQKSGLDKLTDVDPDEMLKGFEEVGKRASGVLVGIWGQMAASGKATLGDFTDAALLTTIKTVRTVIEGHIIEIITASMGLFGPVAGIAIGAGGVLAAEVLLAKWEADARARLGQHGFEKGGHVYGGEQWIRVNEKGEEDVVAAKTAAVNRDILDWLHAHPGQRYMADRPMMSNVENIRFLHASQMALHHHLDRQSAMMHDGFSQLNSALRESRKPLPAQGVNVRVATELEVTPKLNNRAVVELVVKEKKAALRR